MSSKPAIMLNNRSAVDYTILSNLRACLNNGTDHHLHTLSQFGIIGDKSARIDDCSEPIAIFAKLPV